MINFKIYHFSSLGEETTIKSILDYGLMSPSLINIKDGILFRDKIYDNYIDRVKNYYHKKNIENLDVIFYMNSSEWSPTLSTALYFSFTPYDLLSKSMKLNLGEVLQISVNYRNLIDPILIYKNYLVRPNDLLTFKARKIALKYSKFNIVKEGDLLFEHIPHLAFNENHISPNRFLSIDIKK